MKWLSVILIIGFFTVVDVAGDNQNNTKHVLNSEVSLNGGQTIHFSTDNVAFDDMVQSITMCGECYFGDVDKDTSKYRNWVAFVKGQIDANKLPFLVLHRKYQALWSNERSASDPIMFEDIIRSPEYRQAVVIYRHRYYITGMNCSW